MSDEPKYILKVHSRERMHTIPVVDPHYWLKTRRDTGYYWHEDEYIPWHAVYFVEMEFIEAPKS